VPWLAASKMPALSRSAPVFLAAAALAANEHRADAGATRRICRISVRMAGLRTMMPGSSAGPCPDAPDGASRARQMAERSVPSVNRPIHWVPGCRRRRASQGPGSENSWGGSSPTPKGCVPIARAAVAGDSATRNCQSAWRRAMSSGSCAAGSSRRQRMGRSDIRWLPMVACRGGAGRTARALAARRALTWTRAPRQRCGLVWRPPRRARCARSSLPAKWRGQGSALSGRKAEAPWRPEIAAPHGQAAVRGRGQRHRRPRRY
jgi:hypothetical protein